MTIESQLTGAEPEPGAQPNWFLQLTGGAQPPPHIGRRSRDIDARSIRGKMFGSAFDEARVDVIASQPLRPGRLEIFHLLDGLFEYLCQLRQSP